MLDPLRLKLLVEVRRRGSIAAAAEACHIGQPSASKHLKKLEDALGVKLLERSGRATRPTEAGVVVADHAARVLATLSAMDDELASLAGGARGSLTIAACPTSGAHVLPDLLQCFSGTYPDVTVRVEIAPSAETVARVARGDAQLGVAGETESVNGALAEPFLDDELVGVAAPGNERVVGHEVDARLLAEENLLVREPQSSARQVGDRYISRLGVRPARVWEFGSNEAIKRAAQTGFGIALISRLAVADELERGKLAEFRLAGVPRMPRRINLVRPGDRPLTPSERAFAQTISSCCSVTLEACVVEPTAAAR